MGALALDLFAAAPSASAAPVRGWALSDAELLTAMLVCCTNRIGLSDVERALLRLGRYRARPCPSCARGMPVVTIPPASQLPCPGCNKPIASTVIPLMGINSVTGEIRAYHDLCRVQAAGGPIKNVSSIATFLTTHAMPDCALCGLPYDDHLSDVTTIWEAWCDSGDYYAPSAPFRSRNWPYRLIVAGPHQTPDGRTAYGDEGIAAT